MIILIKLVLAHLLGDFVLQKSSWVKDKETKKLASLKLYLHGIIHFLLTFLVLWKFNYWYIALIVAIFHIIIDAGKLLLQTPTTKRRAFFIDQCLHLAVLLGVAYSLSPNSFHLDEFPPLLLLYFTGFLFLTSPASIIIKTIISVYRPKTEIEKNESLDNAGMYIGILERLLVFVFIITQHWEGVGFLVAAKSIFRFSDLTESKDRKLTEYILIGTLLSFGMAILTGVLVISLSQYFI